ncbi:MAG: alpha-ketoglutarate-dependent dioxygenase AlkB [Alphaproteobacteria bacterium]
MDQLFEIHRPEAPDIDGLLYIPNFISESEHDALLSIIDVQSWLTDLKRRVQHYGYKYDYKARNILPDSYLGELPQWLGDLQEKLFTDGIFKQKPDQAIINEYLPGQGISSHIDCVPCFEDVIASLSLGSDAIMQLSKAEQKHDVFLEKRSLIVLSGEARYKWQHAIPARKLDIVDGVKLERQRRISVTFRKVILA